MPVTVVVQLSRIGLSRFAGNDDRAFHSRNSPLLDGYLRNGMLAKRRNRFPAAHGLSLKKQFAPRC